jgi:hypothetical protein
MGYLTILNFLFTLDLRVSLVNYGCRDNSHVHLTGPGNVSLALKFPRTVHPIATTSVPRHPPTRTTRK